MLGEQSAKHRLRPQFALNLDMLFETARCRVGHGQAAVEAGGERQGHRLRARLDAREDERRPVAGLVRIEHAVTADGDQGESLRSLCLGDVDLAPEG